MYANAPKYEGVCKMHFIFGFWDFWMKMQDKGLCMQCGGCLGHANLKCNVGVWKGLTM